MDKDGRLEMVLAKTPVRLSLLAMLQASMHVEYSLALIECSYYHDKIPYGGRQTLDILNLVYFLNHQVNAILIIYTDHIKQ